MEGYTIVRTVANEGEVQILRTDLKNLAKWDIDWQMVFNVEKYVVLHICGNTNLYAYNINNATFKMVDVERNFGVNINGTYSEH